MTSRITGSGTIANLNYDFDLSSELDAHLVFMVHGKAGNKRVMQIFRNKFSENFSFIYPEAPNQDEKFGGFSWWLENTVENFQEGAKQLSSFTEAVLPEHNLKPRKISAVGFSQGGAVLAAAIQITNLKLDHLGMISSYFPQIKEPANWPEIFIFHGTEDQEIPVQKSLELAEYLASSSVQYSLIIDQVGHKISSRGMKLFKSWIALIS